MKQRLLLAEANTELTRFLSSYFEQNGFETDCAEDGESALKKALNQRFDAILLDALLPKLNGFRTLMAIREHLSTPVILLNACSDDLERSLGLDLGADDYLLKPCSSSELLARLRAVLRRSPKQAPEGRTVLRWNGLSMDCAARQVEQDGKPLELTNTEFNILEILLKSPGQAFSKEELTEYALGRRYTAYDRSIDVHISNLRNKLSDHPTSETWITTVRGFGYLLNKAI